jgi:hypothetical protein
MSYQILGFCYENLGSYYKTEFDLYLDHKILVYGLCLFLRLVFQYLTGNYFQNNYFIF